MRVLLLIAAVTILGCQSKQNNLKTEQKKFRNDWRKYIIAFTPEYAVEPSGGIRDLKVFLNNRTNDTLDEVTVRLEYINPNGESRGGEFVEFDKVPPKHEVAKIAHGSQWGKHVKLTFLKIHSFSLNFCWTEQMLTYGGFGPPDDPYYCE